MPHMFRVLLRLIRALLPACIVGVTWTVWCALPERPLREWRLDGPFGVKYARFDLEEARVVLTAIPRPFNPNAPTLGCFRCSFSDETVGNWQMDLNNGTFSRLADDNAIAQGIGIVHYGPKLTCTRNNDVLLIVNSPNESPILRIPCSPNSIEGNPTMSRDGRWLAISEVYAVVPPKLLLYLAHWFGISAEQIRQVHTRIFETMSGKKVNTIPSWDLHEWISGADQFWTVDTMFTSSQAPKGVTVRLWSVHAAPPPWWLWSLTIAGVVWYAHRVWRWRSINRRIPAMP